MTQQSLQSTGAVLMVHPTTFGFDDQTAATNSFQHTVGLTQSEVRKKVSQEFAAMVAGLQSHGVQVEVFDDPDVTEKLNAVFPNNWFSTWSDGRMYLYPMATASRRIERSQLAINQLQTSHNISELVDISDNEKNGRYLESTGVLVFDHINKTVYACLSQRCDEILLRNHAAALGYEPIAFHAYDETGAAIYHTNVLMGIQTATAVICSQAITDVSERELVLGKLRGSGREVVEITQQQMNQFCGNVLELQNTDGQLLLAMSDSAFQAFTDDQREVLAADKTLLPFLIPTIEMIGGGSVRCMLAELFLPPKQ
jgi:hypothetical protein